MEKTDHHPPDPEKQKPHGWSRGVSKKTYRDEASTRTKVLALGKLMLARAGKWSCGDGQALRGGVAW